MWKVKINPGTFEYIIFVITIQLSWNFTTSLGNILYLFLFFVRVCLDMPIYCSLWFETEMTNFKLCNASIIGKMSLFRPDFHCWILNKKSFNFICNSTYASTQAFLPTLNGGRPLVVANTALVDHMKW